MIMPLRKPFIPLSSKSRPTLWLVASLVFAGLVFTAGAQAQGTNAPVGTAEAQTGEAASVSGAAAEQAPSASEAVEQSQPPAEHEQSPPVSEDPPPTSEQTTPVTGQIPSADEQVPPAAEQAPSASEAVEQPQPPAEQEQSPPVAEESAHPVEQSPPVTEDSPPTSEQTTPVTEQAPPPVEKTSTAEEASPTHERETTEKQDGEATGEASSEGRATEVPGASQTPADASVRKEPANEVAPVYSTAVTAANTATATPDSSKPAGEDQALIAFGLASISARQARRANRELATCGALTIATGYFDRWLYMPGASPASTIAFAADEVSPAAMIATAAPGRDRDGGLTVENHPSAPISGSGGAGGGSAAGGGSGSAPSASSMLVGALLQTAPSVMRLLCVSQPSWCTTFFVLIPERPG
jgi:hypothetical protein